MGASGPYKVETVTVTEGGRQPATPPLGLYEPEGPPITLNLVSVGRKHRETGLVVFPLLLARHVSRRG